MTGFTLKKSFMERYDIRINNENNWRCTWATISISEDGFFNAQTDCGNFSYNWNAFGDSFKEFLLEINDGYLYNKIARKEELVDGEATVKTLKTEILNERKSINIDEFEAREAWEELEELETECYRVSPEVFHYALADRYVVNKVISDIYEVLDIVYLKDNEAQTFCEVVMPIFVEILKKELAKKKAV